jgi:DNA-binding CsgD family transcriptional regulator
LRKKLTACPGWLEISPDRTSFILVPERAEVVRLIFDWSIAGVGAYTIARRLDARRVPTFGSSETWDPSSITNLLRNRATVGEYQPKRYHGGKVGLIGDPVPNYYPRVVDEHLYQAARIASRKNLSGGRGRKGRLYTNLFAGISDCLYCRAPVKFHSNGQAKSLICATVLEMRGCRRVGWSYSNFEETFFSFLERNRIDADLAALLTALVNAQNRDAEQEIFETRMEIARSLKTKVLRLSLASSGETREQRKANATIRRDTPGRYFELQFKDQPCHLVRPDPPKAEAGPELDRSALAIALRLSPRQAELTGLLVERLSLAEAAKKLEISLETARWHLREIFRRTNTHSQAALVESALETPAKELPKSDRDKAS